MGRAAALTLLLLVAAARADEAVPHQGKRQAGSLILDDHGRLLFQPADRSAPVPLTELREVRLSPSVPPVRTAAAVHVVLADGQTLTGPLDRCADGRLHLRAAWGKVELPLEAVRSFGPRPGWRISEVDVFADGLKGWKASGKPAVGEDGVALRPGESLKRSLARPLTHGRAGVNVSLDEGRDARAEVVVLLGEQALRITLTERALTADVPGIKGTACAVAPKPGWRRVEVELGPGGLRALIDNEVLWYSAAPPGKAALTGIELHCAADDRKPAGAARFAAFGTEDALTSRRRPSGDSSQDEVWLPDGDQLFGKLRGADLRGVTLESRGKKHTLPWAEVRGVFPAPTALKPEELRGEHVRVELENTLDPTPDRLLGVVTALDGKTLKLRTPLLGELTIPRAALRSIEGLGNGRREYLGVPAR